MSSSSAETPEKSLQSNFEKLQKLYDEKDGPKKHQAEISDILLWIATKHPEALQEESLPPNFDYIKVRRLYFRDSWVDPKEPLPTDAIVTLLKSDLCSELKAFCGYVNPAVLEHFREDEPINMRLALGKDIDVQMFLKKLKERRLRIFNELIDDEYTYSSEEEELAIHLRSRELDPKNLTTLPDLKPSLYITDVKDEDADWVVKALVALEPKLDPGMHIDPEEPPEDFVFPYIESLYLPHSELTAAGVEAIAKGLFEAGMCSDDLSLSTFEVSSSYFLNDDVEIPGYEDEDDFCATISEKYNIEDFHFTTDESMDFKDYAAYICEEKDSDEDSWEDNKYMYGWGTYGTTLDGQRW